MGRVVRRAVRRLRAEVVAREDALVSDEQIKMEFVDDDVAEIGSECEQCEGTGYGQESLRLYKNFHSGSRWQFDLTDDEIKLLFDGERLWDFDRCPTRDELNAWQRRGFGLDVVARHLCTQARSMRLSIYSLCEACGGDGMRFH